MLDDERVAGDAWRPVVGIDDRGLVLGVDPDGSWVGGRWWNELLRFALDWPTDYWPGLAMTWIEDGYPIAAMRGAVTAVTDDRRRSQALRHRAVRLCKPLHG